MYQRNKKVIIAFIMSSIFLYQNLIADETTKMMVSPAIINYLLDSSESNNSDYILQMAFENKEEGLQVQGVGKVNRLLSDDTSGSQHQRFIIELISKQTLLVAHNIDLAPRIDTLQVNDIVKFYGVYEWNSEGGVIHWTHNDPDGIHKNGWLKHDGIIYQ